MIEVDGRPEHEYYEKHTRKRIARQAYRHTYRKADGDKKRTDRHRKLETLAKKTANINEQTKKDRKRHANTHTRSERKERETGANIKIQGIAYLYIKFLVRRYSSTRR